MSIMEICMKCLMQEDNPAGILRTENVRKDIENTEILEQTNEIATGGTTQRSEWFVVVARREKRRHSATAI
jgi:hypothetical protein